MKIAITNTFLPSEEQSGVPTQVHQLANALCARDHSVTVFSFSPAPPDAHYTLRQYARPNVPRRFFPFFMAVRLAATDFAGFDVVNTHGDNYLLRTSRPVVRTFHGSAADELRHAQTLRRRLFFLAMIPLEWLAAWRANYVVGVSETTREKLPAVQLIIPCGVDLEVFRPGSKTEQPTVLFVGTEDGRKRGAWLAGVFRSEVLTVLPHAELRMVSEGTLVETGIRRYGRVSREQLAELYRSSWAFCLPSTYEGFGVPYAEAMASGTAVIATTPNPGAREVLGDGKHGAFVADADLGATLRRVLTDAALRNDLERRGCERSRTYSWSQTAARYEKLFARAITSQSVRMATA